MNKKNIIKLSKNAEYTFPKVFTPTLNLRWIDADGVKTLQQMFMVSDGSTIWQVVPYVSE